MKIIEVTKNTIFSIKTDEKVWPHFRRDKYGNWEQLMGESWESVIQMK